MSTNNFKKLEEHSRGSQPVAPPEIKRNVQSSLGLINYVSKVVELYIPKVFQMLISLAGGRADVIDQSPKSPPDMRSGENSPRGFSKE